MGDNDLIVVTEEARKMMLDLETTDPGAPGPAAIRTVSGAHLSTAAQNYRNVMASFAAASRETFQNILMTSSKTARKR